MKEEQMKVIVESIINATILGDWYFYLIMFSVSLIGAYFGGFIKSFGTEKGKYKAIESSLDTIKKQVSETTKVAEKIKSDLELNIWREKDREILKRAKLEEYFSLILISKEASHSEMENKYFKSDNSYDEQAFNKADMLQALYLPDLEVEHDEYRQAYMAYRKWLAVGMVNIYNRMEKGEKHVTPTTLHMDKYVAILEGFQPPLESIKIKSREIANKINT